MERREVFKMNKNNIDENWLRREIDKCKSIINNKSTRDVEKIGPTAYLKSLMEKEVSNK